MLVRALSTLLPMLALLRLMCTIPRRMCGGTSVPLLAGGSVGDDYQHAGMFSFSINSRVENLTWSFGSAFTFY